MLMYPLSVASFNKLPAGEIAVFKTGSYRVPKKFQMINLSRIGLFATFSTENSDGANKNY